jgi:hypothetical protein
MLEVLHRAFVGCCFLPGAKRAKVAALSSSRIFLSRIESILSRLEFSDHDYLLRRRPHCGALISNSSRASRFELKALSISLIADVNKPEVTRLPVIFTSVSAAAASVGAPAVRGGAGIPNRALA